MSQTTSTLKPVLLSKSQMEALSKIRDEEIKNSQLGVAPSIHVIARQLMDIALSYVARTSHKSA